jgi:hypothetical protein
MGKRKIDSYDDILARARELKKQAERKRLESAKKGPLTQTQVALLEHLAVVAVRQKAEARATKRKFRGGWTHVRPDQHVKLTTIHRLLDLGYASACCVGHYGCDNVRITRAGVEVLESIRGETIYA